MTQRRYVLPFVIVLLCGCGPLPELIEQDPETPPGELLARFAQIADVHVTDEESPARFLRLDGLAGMLNEAWRPQEAYAVHGLDASIEVLNAYHAGALPHSGKLDFVLVSGDVADNAQANELRWFVDTMDGQQVTPDSGVHDGRRRPVPVGENPKLAYQTRGLHADIPWYVARGNHDARCAGVFPVHADPSSPDIRTAAVPWFAAWAAGLWLIEPGLCEMRPVSDLSPAVVTGAGPPIIPATLQLDVARLRSGSIVPDDDRRFLTKREFIAAFFETSTAPVGHGFTEANLTENRAFYSVRPKPDVPLRLIVLDTVPDTAPPATFADFGVLPREQFDGFLVKEIAAAEKRGEFVLLMSHHPSADFDRPFPGPKVSAAEFRWRLASQPNVIMHLCGHTHAHRISIMPGIYPYAEVETASLIDLPQEMRVIELRYDDSTRTVHCIFRAVSHTARPNPFSAEFSRRALVDAQATGIVYSRNLGDRVFTLALPRPRFVPAVSPVSKP